MCDYTIYALSTAYTKSAIAIVRVSGVNAVNSLSEITKNSHLIVDFNQRTICYTKLYDINGELLDQAIILYFPKDKSYTGESLIEYHVHGSLNIIDDLLHYLSTFDNHQLAQPGEFTKRALLNNKIDVINAEGINDLINAQTQLQRKQALRELSGEIGNKYYSWYEVIKNSLAFFESTIDFSDQDIPHDIIAQVYNNINDLIQQMAHELSQFNNIRKINQGIMMTIVGIPNVGKSTLINKLTNKDIAIVSDVLGTTRDIVETNLDIGGFLVSLADTAGIRETDEVVEKQGVQKAISKAQNSDINLIVLDATNLNSLTILDDFYNQHSIIIVNKIDQNPTFKSAQLINKNVYYVSLLEEINIDLLKNAILDQLKEITGLLNNPIILQQRHLECVNKCIANLKLFITTSDYVIAAFHLRNATNDLGEILGYTNIEDILGIIFSNFCIGK